MRTGRWSSSFLRHAFSRGRRVCDSMSRTGCHGHGWTAHRRHRCAWLAASRPPLRTVASFMVLGLLCSFRPSSWCRLSHRQRGSPGGWGERVPASAILVVRGLSGVLISMATVASVSASSLREGSHGFPCLVSYRHPRADRSSNCDPFLRDQAGGLSHGGAGCFGSGRAAWQILWSLPQVWLPRMSTARIGSPRRWSCAAR